MLSPAFVISGNVEMATQPAVPPLVRLTLTLDSDLAREAHELGVDVVAAALTGVEKAVRQAKLKRERQSYIDYPEAEGDPVSAESWGPEEHATELLPDHLR